MSAADKKYVPVIQLHEIKLLSVADYSIIEGITTFDFRFYPRDAMRKRGLFYRCLSVTRRNCIKKDKDIIIFSRPSSSATMAFKYHIRCEF